MKIPFIRYFLFLIILVVFSCKEKNQKSALDEYKKWHTLTLSFVGPETSESAVDNPFLNYRLTVSFKHGKEQYSIRGFYAADGNAANTGADNGNIWQVRFTPDHEGEWEYSARLEHGDSVSISNRPGRILELNKAKGKFMVVPSDKSGRDFRAYGHLTTSNGYFRFRESGKYWLKGGSNSPENLLAYSDFDNTYRMKSSHSEVMTTNKIHAYGPHIKDWEIGDPTWKNNKGKTLVGVMNYLASKGMNSIYFLTLNIKGDGKDVWPYKNPDDFTRFDVSKLEQWEIIFEHMQSQGIMMHVVLQETENETMLDGGDTGPMRKLYFSEIMARFGHHLALSWNLGEENGPFKYSPIGQNDAQRKAMAHFIRQTDPYKHPIFLHTQGSDPARKNVLDSILGFKDLDGLSLQTSSRETAAQVVQAWKEKSRNTGHEWIVNMDEIGPWRNAALTDSLDYNYETLRGNVLWGTLLSGAGGVEWYFAGKTKDNDLNAESWRTRNHLWELTNFALIFFKENLPYWEMLPNHKLAMATGAFCFRNKGEVYALYYPRSKTYKVDLKKNMGTFTVHWYDPLKGGALQSGSVMTVNGGEIVDLGLPPNQRASNKNQDWVVLLKVVK